MKIVGQQIRLAGSDLSNHLACRHLTTLELQVVRGERAAPDWADPDLAIILERGDRHEKDYLAHLAAQGLTVENLGHIDHKEEARLLAETLALMDRGAQAIAQGALSDGGWFGRPDVLRRVATPSKRWKWSYEVVDTKLARETKATTILQLSLYSELLAKIQGTVPEFLWVVPPGEGFAGEKYRVSEYAAYSRFVMKRLRGAVGEGASKETYPEPVEHCNVCRWFKECDARRRADDHLSLVAGIRRQQRDQFEEWNAETMAKLAALPIPLRERPKHGSKAGYEKVQKQARVQVQRREANQKMHVYHFGGYEPGALKRLMGMYATREDEIDRMLRAGVLVDLHQAFKQGVRASVEEYSLKKVEAFYGFERKTPLEASRAAMRYVEHRLELGWGDEELPKPIREAMEGYNADDCLSTAKLRDWLEEERKKLEEDGASVPRFADRDEEASEELDERQKRVAELTEELTTGMPADSKERSKEQQAQWLLAQLLDWHRREDKATYWEGYRLAELNDEDLLEDRAGLAGLRLLEQ